MSNTNNDNLVVLFGESPPRQSRPYGIYALASYLRRNNIKTQTIWGWRHIPDNVFLEFCQKFLNENVKVVGISSTLLSNAHNKNSPEEPYSFFGCSEYDTRQRFMLIKQLAPNAKIVVGGSQVMYGAINNLPELEFIDLFVKGQGEQALLELAQSPNTRIKTDSLTPPIATDITYPFNNFNTTPTIFDPSDCIMPNEGLAVEFARGCIFNCSFCSYELRSKRPGDYIKTRNALREELLQNYHNHGTTHYYTTDDLINDSEEKVDMILEVSQSLPFKLQYIGCVRLDLIRRFPSMAKKLIDSGMISCFFGIETIDTASGKRVGKGLGLDRINEAIDICNEAWDGKMYGDGSFILGLPNHNHNTKDELIAWLATDRVRKLIKRVTTHPLFITPRLALSDIDKDPAKFGYEYNDVELGINVSHRYDGGMNWKTDTYDFYQAILDSDEVQKAFSNSKKYFTLGSFRIPYLLALSDKKHEMLEVLLTDTSAEWTPTEWHSYLDSLDQNYRDKYIKLMRSL
jgi:radical SAM superfamily enzyme YgiQ (UPF0313 family)